MPHGPCEPLSFSYGHNTSSEETPDIEYSVTSTGTQLQARL